MRKSKEWPFVKRASHEVSNVPNRSHRPVQRRIELSIFMHLNSSSSLQGRFTWLYMLILHTCAGKMSSENEPGNEKTRRRYIPIPQKYQKMRYTVTTLVHALNFYQSNPGLGRKGRVALSSLSQDLRRLQSERLFRELLLPPCP